MDFEINMDVSFLQFLTPPSSYPPSQEQLLCQIQEKFIEECDKFLKQERSLYKCAKTVEQKLKSVLKDQQVINGQVSTEKAVLDHISKELQKNNQIRMQLQNKQQILSMLCEMVRMEQMRNILLLNEDDHKSEKSFQNQQFPAMVDESKYLASMEQLHETILQSVDLQNIQSQYPLIQEILNELQSIFHAAVKKVLRKLLTPKMYHLILLGHYNLFFRNEVTTSQFDSAMVTNRLQHLKISLNPMVNNLNYANNMAELHEHIFKRWIEIIKEDLVSFSKCGRFNIVRECNLLMMAEIMPKLEKNIYRIKDITEAVIIRYILSSFLRELTSIQWSNTENYLKQQRSAQKQRSTQKQRSGQKQSSKMWEPLPEILAKCEILIESKLSEESEHLQGSKYNIYSLASYIPIREHLEKIKICYQYQIEQEVINWQSGFHNLSQSRNPKNYPNNKSLIIFNLNIWYLYQKIVKNGKHAQEGHQIIQWCYQNFAHLNVREVAKNYYQSFQKILELCGNLTAFKSALYSEINLLGHEQLRQIIAQRIRQKFMEVYKKMLVKAQVKVMTNEEVKLFCQKSKINLNKFGKYSNFICVHSEERLFELISYS